MSSTEVLLVSHNFYNKFNYTFPNNKHCKFKIANIRSKKSGKLSENEIKSQVFCQGNNSRIVRD